MSEFTDQNSTPRPCALILGGSSGLGLATAKKLARQGYDIIIVHRDRKCDLKEITSHFENITLSGSRLCALNADATNPDKRIQMLGDIEAFLDEGNAQRIRVLVHSIAKGNLKMMRPEVMPGTASQENTRTLSNDDLQLTLNAMALSLYDWTKMLVEAELFADDTRIISFTSEGSTKAWPGYAAVSAAKATLESLTRSIALEFATLGIKANCIQAGTTDTRSFQMIPGHETLKKNALERNPNKRLTRPEDVANAAYLLTTREAEWITGTVIKVDGGESLR